MGDSHDPTSASHPASEPCTPGMGGGWPVIDGWAKASLSPKGPLLWQTLLHKSACLSCAWGTGGQNGGFVDELGEPLQRCLKSVEAISAELQAAVPERVFGQRSLSQLRELSSLEADRLGRLSHPLILREGRSHYERLGWDDVFELTEAAFRIPPERLASYSSGRSSNEAAYLLQLLLRALGSNNLADCSDLCHAPSTVGLGEVFGSGTSMVSLESLKQADCVVLVGSNAPANHPRLMNELIQLRERGGTVIVINPVLEVGLLRFGSPAFPIRSMLKGSPIASIFLQPIPGSDTAVFVGIQKALLEANQIRREFLSAHAEGWEAVLEQARATSWEAISNCCGLCREELAHAAAAIGRAQGVVFAWAMGITHHANGTTNVHAIANTALLTGNVGKPGAGTMPIRGHSNVQGFGSMGVTVKLRAAMQQALEELLGRQLSPVPGYDTRALIEAAEAGRVDTLLCLGGNLWGANPDSSQARRALGRIDTIAYLATKPNQGHFHGLAAKNTLLLPVFNRFETPHRTTTESGNNFVRLNEPGSTHLKAADLISEVGFLAELARRLLGSDPIDWGRLQDPVYVRQLIARTVPGYGPIAAIDATRREFSVEGRVFERPSFPTPSGKARMEPTPLPALELPEPAHFGGLAPGEPGLVLVLITARSYGQHNTVVYKAGDAYRAMPHRQTILMNRTDLARSGLAAHQQVTVQGEAGRLEGIEIIPGEIREGAALMFYPEVNAIIRVPVDRRSGTPAFKRAPVLVRGGLRPAVAAPGAASAGAGAG
ncbi:FdhF/YdeP family oxidoreductase [Synechococcus sp. Tobar12-5m-g]|uniref:FdhF/YdeP family oxidoreductase n=1 Tax=unclassified Synechococcus TaxID=2626047 RepID=UPI0037DA6F2A|nr:FdhF/YdeP family oxidoreductase [Synechococcus sp. Tobar12-5m-g]MCP9874319.1 FdhF/YdeP family oxidoreductase [Synechococcus sp. Cruz CV-v-12]